MYETNYELAKNIKVLRTKTKFELIGKNNQV